ncbi:MAG: M23 family metallopeptidase [Brevefilum sp.]|nr:M23 family metallopeptidase [Brevefilum sp.]
MKKFVSVIIFMLVCVGLFNSPRTAAAQPAFEPRVEVLSAKQDLHVVIYAHGFPAFLEIQVSMRVSGADPSDRLELTTINALETGSFFQVFHIPEALAGEAQIEIELAGIKSRYAAQNVFANQTFTDEEAIRLARENKRATEALLAQEETPIVRGEDVVDDPPEEETPETRAVVEADASDWLETGNDDQVWADPVPFTWPADNHWLSGYDYSETHRGIDIAAKEDDLIYAAGSGKVMTINYSSVGYGNMVMIDHQNGYVTLYAHFNTILTSEGSYVLQGQPIGLSGSTGNSTGAHLHFEIRYQEGFVNPWDYLDK